MALQLRKTFALTGRTCIEVGREAAGPLTHSAAAVLTNTRAGRGVVEDLKEPGDTTDA